METILRAIKREPDGQSISDIIAHAKDGQEVSLFFPAVQKEKGPEYITGQEMRKGKMYTFRVKQWMTEKTTSKDFDFMLQWNNNIPMPFRVMTGIVLEETRGMLKMQCHVRPLRTDFCMKCGKPLTHPVSKLYGIGPMCGQHLYIAPPETEEEFLKAAQDIARTLNEITWEGWVAKSAVEYAVERET